MFATMACTLTGCFSGRPPRVAAPAWDVEGITDKAMEQCDEDNDGLLTKTELKNAPGLEYAFRQLDTDRDKKLSRDEVRQRFQDYLDSKMGIQGFSCYVLLKNGRPLRDGRVRLIPEPFLEGIIEVAEGDVVHDRMGLAEVSMTNDEGLVGVRSGMYRVEITSPSFKVGKKYNEETVLGVEISPFANAYEDPGGIKFRVGK
jgi:hypothetical protein